MLDDFQDEDTNTKSGEFLDEFRQRLSSQPLESLEERKNDINRSQHIFLGTILGIGLAGVVSWFILSPDYAKVEDVEIPVIRRPQAAIKVQPADPGGMEILNQDKTVYDIVEKKEPEEIKVENLLPPPEEPKILIAENSASSDNVVISDNTVVKEAEKIIASENKAPVLSSPSEQPLAKEPPLVKEEKVEVKTPSVKEQPVKVAEEKKQPASSNKVITAPTGSWQIQLISSPNKSAMEKAWNDLSKKYTSLKGLPHEVEAADLGSKGTFYRLKAGAFKERQEADKICNAIKSAGGSCLVKKK